MAASIDHIKQLLGNGLSNEVVANAVGVTPSYISQLMGQEDFASEVIAKRSAVLASHSARDRTWDSAEDKLLETLHQQLDAGGFYKPMDILRAVAVVNAAKRRGNPTPEHLTLTQNVVTLNLPVQVVHTFTKSAAGEVVEVDGQTLVPMTAATLMSQLAAKNPGSASYEQVRRYIPSSAEVKEG